MDIDLKKIANELQCFRETEEKEKFLFVLGALTSRIISIQKAAEVMGMDRDFFSRLLEILGVEFSYLDEIDVQGEKNW